MVIENTFHQAYYHNSNYIKPFQGLISES